MCYSLWYNAPTMLPAGGGEAGYRGAFPRRLSTFPANSIIPHVRKFSETFVTRGPGVTFSFTLWTVFVDTLIMR